MKRPWRDRARREEDSPRADSPPPAAYRASAGTPAPGPTAAAGPVASPKARSVAEVVSRVRELLAHEFRDGVLVQGEASNVRRPRGGHLYLTLKDRRAQLRVVVYERDLIGVPSRIEDGMQVVARGRLDAYPE